MGWQAFTAIISGSGVGDLTGLPGGDGSVHAVRLLLYFVGVPNARVAIGTSAVDGSLNAADNLVGHARAARFASPAPPPLCFRASPALRSGLRLAG